MIQKKKVPKSTQAIRKEVLACFLVFIIIQFVLFLYLGKAYLNPSAYVYTFGGDGSFIYYNMIFHTLYGSGSLLTSMNYPIFESIFLTDAQASVSLLFSYLNKLNWVNFTPEMVVGISHGIHYILLSFAGIIAYKYLIMLKVRYWWAICFGILIVLFSPLLQRLDTGHFGLAYPIVFLYTFYFILNTYTKQRISFFQLFILVFILLFFGINNFYVTVINLSFLSLISIYFLFKKAERAKAILLLIFSFSLIAILYSISHFTDPGMDRVEIQWGYYANKLRYYSLFFPEKSLLHGFISNFIKLDPNSFESWINIGLVPFFTLCTLPFVLKKRKLSIEPRLKHVFIATLSACFVLLIFASALLYNIPFFKQYIFHRFEVLTMFKASIRFAWPLYFFSVFLSVYLIHLAITSFKSISKNYRNLFIVLLILIWSVETHFYLDKVVFDEMFENPYTSSTQSDILNEFKAKGIQLDEYQAIYSLPVIAGWNDKFQLPNLFITEFRSILISMSTGLPMINGKLSRIGVSSIASAIQMSSHPIIEKERLGLLDLEKKILIVYGISESALTAGEQNILDKSTLLLDKETYQILSLDPKLLDHKSYRKDVVSKYFSDSLSFFNPIHQFPLYQNSFESSLSPEIYSGKGAYTLESNEQLFEENLSLESQKNYEASLYIKLDNYMYDMARFELILKDENENIIDTYKLDPMKSKDISKSWVRSSILFQTSKDVEKIELRSKNVNQKFFVDEFMIRPIEYDFIGYDDQTNEINFNNYIFSLED